jgi:hypothetical protein
MDMVIILPVKLSLNKDKIFLEETKVVSTIFLLQCNYFFAFI